MPRRRRKKLPWGLLLGLMLLVGTPALVWSGPSSSPSGNTIQIAQQVPTSEEQQVREAVISHLLQGRKPGAKPEVDSVVVEGDYALASWILGETGGSAGLKKEDGSWQVILFGGGAVNAQNLTEKGIPTETAKILIKRQQEQWEQGE